MDRTPERWDEGYAASKPVDLPGRLQKHELRIGQAESITSMLTDYAFFTPAIPYLLGVLTDAPLHDFLAESCLPVKFYWTKFRYPIFRGLDAPDGDKEWNYGLWAVERAYWPIFLDFYCSLCVFNRASGHAMKIAMQELTVMDPLALDRGGLFSGLLPNITIAAFGVDSSQARVAFVSTDPVLDPPRLVRYPPRPTTKDYAKALQRGEDPVLAAELISVQQRYKELGL